MDALSQLAAGLANAGGWTAFVFLVIVVGGAAWRAFKNQDVVSGGTYRAMVAERDAWMQRSIESDKRIDRLSDNFEAALKMRLP